MNMMQFILLWYIGINVFSFLAYDVDKKKAVNNEWRISEKFLLLLSVFGGGIGSFFGMGVFHHKTQKMIFRIWVPLWIVLHIALLLWGNERINFTKQDDGTAVSVIGGADGPTSIFIAGKIGDEEMSYKSITMDEAVELLKQDASHILVDVRTPDEYAEGHIPGAINIVNEEIKDAPGELPDKDQLIYVYCRSGRRSKEAAQKLYDLGYKNVVEIGGILDYKGEIENGNL